MQELKGNMFEMECDALCITTNGFIKSNGACVMGAGIARQINALVPGIDKILGLKIAKEGNNVHALIQTGNIWLVSFPVKPVTSVSNGNNFVSHKFFPIGATVPGWACKADIIIIERSAHQLVKLADRFGWKKVILPRPGCGRGELRWSQVKPILDKILDDRFYACTY